MSKAIRVRLSTYIQHKTTILVQRAYLGIIDKIFDAEHYDEFEIDDDNNIYISYSLKKDESIIVDAHDIIIQKITTTYRKKLSEKLEEDGYFIEYDDSNINVYFEKVIKIDNMSEISTSSSTEHNILKFNKDSNMFDLNTGID